MSQRSLIEINHDNTGAIERDPAMFIRALSQYLASGLVRERDPVLERFGVRVISRRHHSDKFYVSAKTDGFPSKLPYEEARASERYETLLPKIVALFPAVELPTKSKAHKAELLEMIAMLMAYIEEMK